MLVIEDYKDLVSLENFFRRLGFDVLSVGKEVLVSDAMMRFLPDLVIANAKGRVVDGARLAPKVLRHAPQAKIALLFPVGAMPTLAPEVRGLIDALVEIPYRPRSVILVAAQLTGLDPQPILEKYEKLEFGKNKDLSDFKLASPKTHGTDADSVHVVDGTSEGETAQRITGSQDAMNSNVISQVGEEKPAATEARGASAATVASTVVPTAVPGPRSSAAPVVWSPIATPGLAETARSPRSDAYDRFLAENDDGPVAGTLPHAKMAEAGRLLKREAEAEKDTLEKLHADKQDFLKAMFVEGRRHRK
jgi:hypothetical protein